MSEHKENEKKEQTTSDLIELLKNNFASTVNRIYINSVDKDYDFREITVNEQKILARTMINAQHKNQKDVVYEAQCALINTTALDKSFNIFELTEFDRLKLMIALYQANIYKNDIEFTCSECGAKNKYKLDFEAVIDKLDKIKIEEQTFKFESKHWNYEFVIRYPKVSRILDFYKGLTVKQRRLRQSEIKLADSTTNIDYVDMYIKSVKIFDAKTNQLKTEVNFDEQLASNIEEILAVFPQDVLYSGNGVLKFIADKFITPMNSAFEKHQCYNCKTEYKNDIDGAQSFL